MVIGIKTFCVLTCTYVTLCVHRDSIIQVVGGKSEPDYNNINPAVLSVSAEEKSCLASVAGQEEALYTNPDKVVAALNLCGVKDYKAKVHVHT